MSVAIATETILLPHLIADSVCQELAIFLNTEEVGEYADRLAEHADAIYGANEAFRIQVQGDYGREFLASFMQHWLAGYLKAEKPNLFAHLPSGFARGERIDPAILSERAFAVLAGSSGPDNR